MSLPPSTESPATPRHLAIIMDGNGRWAEQRQRSRVRGHREGIESVRAVVRAARQAGVRFLTLYAFSSENWGRPSREVRALMGLLRHFLRAETPELLRRQVRVRTMGDIDRLPAGAQDSLRWAEAETRACAGMDLVLALSYGGRREILRAVQSLVREGVAAEEVDESLLRSRLYLPDLPDPDLLIRTSGEMRISNFLLWQIAYTEIYVTEVLWPDFREPQLHAALQDFAQRERRFGLTTEQVRKGEKQ